MAIFISLIFSILLCLFLIGRVSIFWIECAFVLIPTLGIVVRKVLEKQFSKYLVFDDRTGIYAFIPATPRIFRFYTVALDVFLGMLIGFAIAYFFKGGWA